jgi:hypothetical protein
MVTTFTNGIGSALDGMIQKLNEGKSGWVAFRDGMRSVMADLGTMIQKYITQLIAMWIVQKLVGLAIGGGGDASGMSPSTSITPGGAGSDFLITRAEGGAIPGNIGTPGVDSVPAMLMPGEFVVRKAAVDAYGLDTMFRLNSLKLANGGSASGKKASGAGITDNDDGDEFSLTIINVVDPSSIPKTTSTEILNVISFDAAKNGPTFRTLKAKMKS